MSDTEQAVRSTYGADVGICNICDGEGKRGSVLCDHCHGTGVVTLVEASVRIAEALENIALILRRVERGGGFHR